MLWKCFISAILQKEKLSRGSEWYKKGQKLHLGQAGVQTQACVSAKPVPFSVFAFV